jgi:hypothetical protein
MSHPSKTGPTENARLNDEVGQGYFSLAKQRSAELIRRQNGSSGWHSAINKTKQFIRMKFRIIYNLTLYHKFGKGLFECWIL